MQQSRFTIRQLLKKVSYKHPIWSASEDEYTITSVPNVTHSIQPHTARTPSSRIGNVHEGPHPTLTRPNCLHAARPAYSTNLSISTCWAYLQQLWLTCQSSSQMSGRLSSTNYSSTSHITVGSYRTCLSTCSNSAVTWQYVS